MDDRGRVPFALIGVLVLVTSATLATTLGRRPLTREPPVDAAMDRTSAAVRTALRSAVRTAGRNAAATPVIQPANTSIGRVLNASHAYEDALRIRIYVRARRRLRAVAEHRRGVTTTASLAPTRNASALRRAKRRVRVFSAGPNGTNVRVTVRNVRVTARRDGRVVGQTRFTPTLEVATPVLALHRRVESFERRLNRGVARPGLGQRLTARLYPIAWARGYAQYGGVPIEDVVTNRHVELATNGALVAQQRRAFGHSDPDARAALAVGTARVATNDFLAGTDSGGQQWAETVLDPNREVPDSIPGLVDAASTPSPDADVAVGVGRTADAAFRATVAEENFSRLRRRTYGAAVRVESRVIGHTHRPPMPDAPNASAHLVSDTTRTTATVVGESDLRAPDERGWHRLATYGKVVRRRHERVAVWRWGSTTARTRTTTTDRVRVAVSVLGNHAPDVPGPDREIATVHDRGDGPFDGPNLADLPAAALDRVVAGRGGPDALARRAATGHLDSGAVFVTGDRPPELRAWAYADAVALRERVRNLTVSVPRGDLGTLDANPAARLFARVRARRSALVDAPHSYGSVAARARVAVRAAYLNRIERRLQRRANRTRARRERLDAAMRRRSPGSMATVRRGLAVRDAPGGTGDGPDGLALSVETSPHYLTLTAVGHRRVDALEPGERVHPLVARNVDVPAIPYGDVADAVTGGLVPTASQTSLGTAARSLRAANRTLRRQSDGDLQARRNRLRDAVAGGNRYVRSRIRRALAARNVGDGARDRRRIVTRALSQWQTTADRALALHNGSATRAVVESATRSDPAATATPAARDRLELAVEAAVADALTDPESRPAQSRVDGVTRATRELAGQAIHEAAARGTKRGVDAATERLFDETLGELPAGLPLVPVPGYWYATAGFWHVEVAGRYERVVVRAHRGTPAASAGTVAYVRDGAVARLDVDGDGAGERLGRASKVSFRTSTAVVVVVPPGKTGVGDRGGDADERSAGWPKPG
ncbi:MAG: hypothetical protein ABEI96_06045 [Haloarculaceae archaeon]